jgi:hypothetical protein
MRAIAILVVLLASSAHADPLSQLSGRVRDRSTGAAVEGALVIVTGPRTSRTLTTNANGDYAIVVAPGQYQVMFAYGKTRTVSTIEVVADKPATLDAKIDVGPGEVIVIRERLKPPVEPKAKNFIETKAPPYSSRAILSDAWTKAHMLLHVTAAGDVVRIKWLQKPGWDLEQIAKAEVFKLKFDPARDASGKAIDSYVVWSIEWPSAWWLEKMVGTRSGLPKPTGFPPRPKWHYVPCKGSGPMNLGSLHPTYRDCSQPDLTKVEHAKWEAR